ncbi:uncharacterized protein lrrc69 isoform X3 [Cetorhinus maximus]
MADSLVLRALRGNARQLDLSGKKLTLVPKAVGRLLELNRLQLKNNQLSHLPAELQALDNLTELNLGNNSFEELPEVLKHLRQLKKLHLFDNKLETLSPSVLEWLENLIFLNLSNNKLRALPEEIYRLAQLKFLTVSNNQLESIPSKLCLLQKLCELQLAHNKLKSLPHDIGYLTNLKKLSVPRNQIQELPELLELKLEEFYYEQNPLLEKNLILSTQQNEVLTLQEITARYIMNELKDDSFNEALKYYPEAKKMLGHASLCAVCKNSFLSMWLECVSFVDLTQKISITSAAHIVPIRALLCSYKCFNESGHQFYGIAVP